jgi:hypothetical protein
VGGIHEIIDGAKHVNGSGHKSQLEVSKDASGHGGHTASGGHGTHGAHGGGAHAAGGHGHGHGHGHGGPVDLEHIRTLSFSLICFYSQVYYPVQ